MRINRLIRRSALTLAGLAALLLIFFAWLGYFSANPFSLFRPAGRDRGDVAAVVLSGDMGFRFGMGPQIATRLAGHGIPVVGVNSLSYFRTTRSPAEVTAMLEAAMRQAQAFGRPRKLMLIGQSFGADMLHVGLASLPAELRAQVAMVAMVVPGATVEFRASPSEIFTFAAAEPNALPTARKLGWVPVLCVGGQEEAASLCPLLHQRNAHVVMLPGGHPLHGDAEAVYRQITDEMTRAGLTVPPGRQE